jgi:hypothetical protein
MNREKPSILRAAPLEVASLASKRDAAPDVNVDTRSEIEDPASKLPGGRIGPAVNLSRALLIVPISTANGEVWGDPRLRKNLQPNTWRDIETGEVVSSRSDARSDFAKRTGQKVDFAVQSKLISVEESPPVVDLQPHVRARAQARGVTSG